MSFEVDQSIFSETLKNKIDFFKCNYKVHFLQSPRVDFGYLGLKRKIKAYIPNWKFIVCYYVICILHEKLSWASSYTVADAYGIGGNPHETVCKSDYQYDTDIEIKKKYY